MREEELPSPLAAVSQTGRGFRREEILAATRCARTASDSRSTALPGQTCSSSQLVGTVFLWVDYRMPLRDEMQRVCNAAPKWDRRVCVLQDVLTLRQTAAFRTELP